MNYLLDTNIIIIYSKDEKTSRQIENGYKIFAKENNLAVSIVTIAEINSIVHRFKIGDKRKENLNKILKEIYQVDISTVEILNKYEEIDAFSQGKHKTLKSTFTSRNMGKNDIWIAATASALGVPLITTDKDFKHLDGVFLELILIDRQKYK